MMICLKINGRDEQVDVHPLSRLIDVLREKLNLMGTKEGCGEGECGSCTVLLDNEPVNACLVPVGQCEGREVLTVEGIVEPSNPSPLARAFVKHGAAQCGICTPGMIVSAYALLRRIPRPDDDQIREGLAGNICRCTGYQGIVDAVAKASRQSEEVGR